jgi:hypothetical protein
MPRKDPDEDGGTPAFPTEPPPRSRPPQHGAPAPEDDTLPSSVEETARDLFGAPALKRRPRGEDPADLAETVVAPGVDTAPAEEPAVSPAPALPLGLVRDAWPRVIAQVHRDHIGIAAILENSEPVGEQRGTVEIAAPDAFSRDTLDRAMDLIRSAVATELRSASPPLRFSVAARSAETVRMTDPFERLRVLNQEHPVFRVLTEKFGAEPHFP